MPRYASGGELDSEEIKGRTVAALAQRLSGNLWEWERGESFVFHLALY